VIYVELDALHHGANWTSASAAELRERVLGAIDGAHGWASRRLFSHRSVGCV
jgi:hypothetical protein